MALRSRLARYLPPIMIFAGLVLFAGSLLFLAGSASGEPKELAPAFLETVNGTGVLVFPARYYSHTSGELHVNYTFPSAPGDALYLSCEDTERVRAGQNATQPFLAFRQQHQGEFVVSDQTVGETYRAYIRAKALEEEREQRGCVSPAVVFTWFNASVDPAANRPAATVRFTPDEIDPADAVTSLLVSIGGATLVLAGGLLWSRERAPAAAMPHGDEGTAEALRHSLDQMASQLERTRRHLLLAGILGIFLWYPFIVPWAYNTAKGATSVPWIPWAMAAGSFLFLASLTALWAREFAILDRTLVSWRARLAELRKREEGLLDRLEGG